MAYEYLPAMEYPDPVPPCTNDEMTPQKVCGDLDVTITPSTTPLELQWSQYTHTTSGSANTAAALSAVPLLVLKASISADAGNTADVGVGPTSAANLYTIPAGVSGYVIEMPDGTAFDLADWFSKSTATSQTLRVAYLPPT